MLAGTSRTQVGLDPKALARHLPGWTVIQLAIDGTHGTATVLDLSLDPRFRGVVVCDTLGPAEMTPDRVRNQQPYVETFRTKRGTLEPWGYSVSAAVQEHLVLLNPALSLKSVMSSLLSSRQLPSVSRLITRSDRLRMADYQGQDLEPLRQRWRELNANLAKGDEAARRGLATEHSRFFHEVATRLEARGAKLVLLRMPRSPSLDDVKRSAFPDDWWWPAHAANPHLIAVDAAAEPRLSGYQCPDASHLDRRDLNAFASDLYHVLASRGAFDPSKTPVPSAQGRPGSGSVRPEAGSHNDAPL